MNGFRGKGENEDNEEELKLGAESYERSVTEVMGSVAMDSH